jgi:hypothetical protein
VLGKVALNEQLDSRSVGGLKVAALEQVLGQRPAPRSSPRLERRHELALVDEANLKGEQPEQQVSVGGHRQRSRNAGRAPKSARRRAEPRLDRLHYRITIPLIHRLANFVTVSAKPLSSAP